MLPGPILRREMKAVAGRRGYFVSRSLLALLLGLTACSVGVLVLTPDAMDSGVFRAEALRWYAGVVCAVTAFIEVFFLAVWTPMTVASSIAEEREKDTLPVLLLTRLTRLELVTTKLAGRLVPSLLLTMTGLPLILAGAWAADLPALLVIEVLAVVASTSVVTGSLAILASSRRDRSGTACGEAIVWTMAWLLVVPLVSFMPVRSGTLWGEFLVELRRLASWIAPSSPLSLLTDQSWRSGAADALADRLAIMLAMQAADWSRWRWPGACGREPPAPRAAPQGYLGPPSRLPAAGSATIPSIKRTKYDLPMPQRGSRLPLVVIHARQMLIVIRAILVLVLRGVFLTLGVIVPLGMAIAAGWFGYHAFREYWGSPSTRSSGAHTSAGPSSSRSSGSRRPCWALGRPMISRGRPPGWPAISRPSSTRRRGSREAPDDPR